MRRIVPKELLEAYGYLGRARVNVPFLLLSVGLSVLVAFLNLYFVRLLFPLVQGIVTHNFAIVKSMAFLRRAVQFFPAVFSQTSGLFLLLVFWVYFISILKSAMGYVLAIVVRREALQVARQIRITILDRYLRFGKLFFDRANTAGLVWQATNCNRWIEGLFVGFQMLLSNLLELAVYLLIMTKVSWQLTLSVLLAVPLFRLGRLLMGHLQSLSVQSAKALNDLHAKLTQLLSFLTLVRTSGQTEHERNRIIALSTQEASVSLRVHRVTSLMEPVQQIISTTALVFMSLALSFFIGKGDVEPSKLFVFFFLVLRMIPVLNSLAKFRVLIASETASARAYDALMDDKDKHIVPSGPRAFPGAFESVEFRHLNFSYDGGKTTVLRDINVTIPGAAMVGLVGATGAGKTTLIHLLFRFYDCPPGMVFVNGVDIREFDIESLRENMALVSQDAPVLQESVRDNILYSAPRVPSDAEFNRIIEKARLTDFIAGLPKGLDTLVGERGVTLSGGERQRIAIARALLKGASLLVLDEPTSALDPQTERLIAEATRELTRGKMTIVIAHRMSTIQKADSIVVLERGKVVQNGPPARLAEEDGLFRRFVQAQSPTGPDITTA